jgi:hypothetical protein
MRTESAAMARPALRGALGGTVCALALCSPPAWAEGPGWGGAVTQSLSHDSNLFRLPGGTWPAPGASRSDTVSTTSLDLSLDQPLGRQRLSGQAGLQALRYRFHDEQNHEAAQGALRLDWETAQRLSGQVRAAAARTLRPLDPDAALAPRQRNLETDREAAALVRLGGAGLLSLEGQIGVRSVDFSDPAFDSAELRSRSASLGLRWRPSGVSSWGAAWRETRGHYPDAATSPGLDDRYRSRALDLWLVWAPSGAHRLYLRASPTRARYDLREERNFSGLTGALAWQWAPRSPWRLAVRAVRDLGQDAYLERYGYDGTGAEVLPGGHLDEGVVLTRLAVTAEKDVTAKVKAVATVASTRRTLALSAGTNGAPPSSTRGHDTTSQAALGLRWAPRRNSQLGCEAATERRQADGTLSTPYSVRTFSCFGRLAW